MYDILIGGDLNEDLNKENGEKRSIYIKQFINNCNLNICYAGSTYINPQGQVCSEILVCHDIFLLVSKLTLLITVLYNCL
jgi:hypothetical protein